MANKVYEESNISAIADAIRSKTGSAEKYYTSEMADGVAEVYEAGKKAEYDAFWDSYQNNGNRSSYGNAFSGEGWNDDVYNPKYSMQSSYSYAMFYGSRIYDIYKDGKVSIDFSKSTEIGNLFSNSLVRYIDVLDTSSATVMNTLLYRAQELSTINKLVIHQGITSATNTFGYCGALENVTIEGVIPVSIDIHWSPLTYDSILSIITHLSDTVTGQTLTLSKAAVNKAFETSASANDGSTSAEWLALVASKPNWTISLA